VAPKNRPTKISQSVARPAVLGEQRFRERAESEAAFIAFRAEHPLKARVWLAYLESIDCAFEAILTRGDAQEFERCASRSLKLASCLGQPISGVHAKQEKHSELEKRLDFLIKSGLPVGLALHLAEPLKQRKGRPVSKRVVATLALEKRLQDQKGWSWMRLATQFCECKKERHDSHCQQRLRQEVRLLQKTLKELGV
jgi:hypothetical protein